RSEDEIGRLVDEVRDRYGPPPNAVLKLADFARIPVLAGGLGVETLHRGHASIVIKFRQKTKVDLVQVIALVQERGDLQLLPPNSLKLDLKHQEPEKGRSQLQIMAESRKPQAPSPKSHAPAKTKIQRKPSWW